ncbi:DivIVA domain-containing protein [Micromonospora sp. NPDC049275]|uniref:DivIVA domain-containing protein n=1 Tax=Micromonospora sp. NPDC049275 TaxID=3364268 RepID=UPI003720E5AA
MRKPVRTAAVLVGLGVGTAVGPSLGPAAVWSGVTVAALGAALFLIGGTEARLVEDGLVDRGEVADDAATGPQRRRGNRETPTLSGLGTRVEQILDLAEEQADDHREVARLEAEGIVTAARREAEALLNRAHEQAAGITGVRWEPNPIPPTRASAADDDPGRHA